MDCDPAGVDILCNYTFGSMKNPELSNWLTVPFIHWLGLFPSDIIDTRFKIPLNKADEKILERQKKMAPLTHGTRYEAWIDILEQIEEL